MKNNQNKILNKRNIIIVVVLLIAFNFLRSWYDFRPTPLILGQWVVKDGAKIIADGYEIGGAYKNGLGNVSHPPSGTKYVYLHIKAENLSLLGSDILSSRYRFELVSEKQTYFEDNDYYNHQEGSINSNFPQLIRPDYMNHVLNQPYNDYTKLDGWIRWEVPIGLDLRSVRFQITKVRFHNPGFDL